MSADQEGNTSPPTVREAVAVFTDAEAMESAVDELLSHGFDRAEVSLLAGEQAIREKLGHMYEDAKEVEDDPNAPRTAFVPRTTFAEAEGAVVSALFFVGAVAAVGTVVASGGTVAVAIAAAAGVGGAGAAIGAVLARVIDRHHADHLQSQIDRGGLLLWVNLRDADHEKIAVETLRKHAGQDVHVHELPAG